MPDNPLMKVLLEAHELLGFAFHQLRQRDSCPAADHFGNVLLGHFFGEHGPLLMDLSELPLTIAKLGGQLVDGPVPEFGRLPQIS